MRLLNTGSLTLEEFHSNFPSYAILSHRWGESEISYTQIISDHLDSSQPGHEKVEACCRLAKSRGLQYVWIDTCCIDKSSSAELTESINSMYEWYQRAKECYAYLNDVHMPDPNILSLEDLAEFRHSAWFTRSWTLQELIAPSEVLFYDSLWDLMGSKYDFREVIEAITGIDAAILSGTNSPFTCSVAQRMSWAAGRQATRLEDEAYSLLGLFNVNIAMLYGEEQKAFQRLQEEIMRHSDDQTLLAWSDDCKQKSVLAPSPSCFRGLDKLQCVYPTNDMRLGYSLGNAGLSIHLMLIPWAMNTYLVPLSCGWSSFSGGGSIRGYERAQIFLRQTPYDNHMVRVMFNEKDTASGDADYIAKLRDRLAAPTCKVFINQNADIALVPLAYGFQFSFGHKGINPFLIIKQGSHKIAGTLRLSGMKAAQRVPYMHLGFDLDFAPVCLITTEVPYKYPDTGDDDPDDDIWYQNIGNLWGMERLLNAVQKAKTSRKTILAFTGHRNRGAEIECAELNMKVVFKIAPVPGTKLEMWHVSYENLLEGRGTGESLTSNLLSKTSAPVRADEETTFLGKAITAPIGADRGVRPPLPVRDISERTNSSLSLPEDFLPASKSTEQESPKASWLLLKRFRKLKGKMSHTVASPKSWAEVKVKIYDGAMTTVPPDHYT